MKPAKNIFVMQELLSFEDLKSITNTIGIRKPLYPGILEVLLGCDRTNPTEDSWQEPAVAILAFKIRFAKLSH